MKYQKRLKNQDRTFDIQFNFMELFSSLKKAILLTAK